MAVYRIRITRTLPFEAADGSGHEMFEYGDLESVQVVRESLAVYACRQGGLQLSLHYGPNDLVEVEQTAMDPRWSNDNAAPESVEPSESEFPHCDNLVLHEPLSCRYCDQFPKRQQSRITNGMAFTGQTSVSELLLCPAEVNRRLADIERWPGNRRVLT